MRWIRTHEKKLLKQVDCNDDGSICFGDIGWNNSLGNGVWDAAEPFVDGDGVWNSLEVFEDVENGVYDFNQEIFLDGITEDYV